MKNLRFRLHEESVPGGRCARKKSPEVHDFKRGKAHGEIRHDEKEDTFPLRMLLRRFLAFLHDFSQEKGM